MLRKLFIGLLSALIGQQVAIAQQDPNQSFSAAAQSAAAAFSNPGEAPPEGPLPAPVGQVGYQDGGQFNSVDATNAQVPGGGEVLLTGPLHEAYAEQFTIEATPGLIVRKQPPEAIDEVPPEYRPDGYNVVWIPGYWGWDEERDDFVWVTGIWRQAPPDRNWIPGYWAQVPEGYQWISGFWSFNKEQEIVYLPQPPQPVEAGPSSQPPGDDYFWIPGQWTWIDNNYHWRAGYWSVAYPEWIWVPERYVYTPRGYIYRVGYWDYLLPRRGTIFCPVYWSHPVATYRFQPTYVVNVGTNLLAHLFVHPHYHHYYFGNYYSSPYLGRTIYPWVTFNQQSRMYDPLYGYYQTQRRDAQFLRNISQMHTHYASSPNLQPPRTLAMQLRNPSAFQTGELAFRGTQLQNLADDRQSPWQVTRLKSEERERLQAALQPARELRAERAKIEVQAGTQAAQDARPGESLANQLREGAANQAEGAKRDNRWRLPKSQEGLTLGAAAIAPRLSEQGREDRTGGIDRGDESQRAATQARALDEALGRMAERSGTDRPGPDRRGAVQPGTGQPGAGQPGAFQPRADRPGLAQPGAGQSQADQARQNLQRSLRQGRLGTEGTGAARRDSTPGGGTGLPGGDRRSTLRPEVPAVGAPSGAVPGTSQPGGQRLGDGRPGSLGSQPLDRGLPRGSQPPRTSSPDRGGFPGGIQGLPRRETQPPTGSSPDRGSVPGGIQGLPRREAQPPASSGPGQGGFPGGLQGLPRREAQPREAQPRASSGTGGGFPGGLQGLQRREAQPPSAGGGGGGFPGGIQGLQRREAQPRSAAPPEVRSAPQRPQFSPGSIRPDAGSGRGSGPSISPRPSAPSGGPAIRGLDRGKDKDKGKDKK